ncbi:MAG: winged helix-turn-helix transcriptional regulator [Nanoarchaeota archaeon]|nr:winged helix-turn-helix transcriptional regulator [Nanoarchaeota archaeon]
MVKRARLEIIRDILKMIQENRLIKVTPLIRKSNLSTSRFKEYYLDLLEKRLIREVSEKTGKKVALTEKGFRFLEKYKTIIDFIDEFEL